MEQSNDVELKELKAKNRNLYDAYKNGELALVDLKKSLPKIRPSELERQKPKRELSERQRANVQRLVEINKKRAEERRALLNDAIPDEIPEDKVLAIVEKKAPKGVEKSPKVTKVELPKRGRGRPRKNPVNDDSEYEVADVISSQISSVAPSPPSSPPRLKPKARAKKPEPEPEYEYEPEPPKKTKPKPKPKPTPKKKVYDTDTSTTSHATRPSSDSDSDSEVDDAVLQKYIRKTGKRVDAIKRIEEQLKRSNPYTARGLSLF